MAIYVGNRPTTIVRLATLEDIHRRDGRTPTAADEAEVQKGTRFVLYENGHEYVCHEGFLRADGGEAEIRDALRGPTPWLSYPVGCRTLWIRVYEGRVRMMVLVNREGFAEICWTFPLRGEPVLLSGDAPWTAAEAMIRAEAWTAAQGWADA